MKQIEQEAEELATKIYYTPMNGAKMIMEFFNRHSQTGEGQPDSGAATSGERFKRPTDEQIIKTALIFNDGRLDAEELTDMVSMCMFVVDRLYENGDIMIPSSKENNDAV